MDSTPIGAEDCPFCERMAKQIADLQRRLDEACTIMVRLESHDEDTENWKALYAFLAANRKP